MMTDHDFNLYAHFHKQFQKHADKVLLTTELGQEYRYIDIRLESARLACFLTEMGIQVGDRISVQVQKSPQALCLYLACLQAGFVFHPLNTGYQESELEYFLNNAEPTLVVCDESALSTMQRLASTAGVPHVLTLNSDGTGSLIARSRSASTDFTAVVRAADDLAALLYSSGTTGVPKGIMLSHANLLCNAESLVQAWGFTDEDCLFHALPIFHVHGLFVALGCVLLSGASMQWQPGFNAKNAVALLPRCSVMMGVPTYYTRLLNEENFNRDTVKTMRLFISGSAPLLVETFNEFEQRTGHSILERYGMTETNMNTSNPLQGERKPGTVGLPLPGVTVRITDEENNVIANGEVGNLQVTGPNVFKGYWKMPEKTAEDFTSEGFFNTGDKGRIDEDGYVAIVGRAKDMVITGGLNVYPKEIELLVDDLPGVKESAVIGVPHSDFGEAVVAIVVSKVGEQPTENDIISAVKNSLANFKVPKRVVFVSELPRNTMGKVQKNVLRERYQD
ncbi:MAG: malonyl-CoA synthase [Gammaproteobacteria bacterium]